MVSMYAPQGLPAVCFPVLASSVIIVAAKSGLLLPCIIPPLGLRFHVPELLSDARRRHRERLEFSDKKRHIIINGDDDHGPDKVKLRHELCRMLKGKVEQQATTSPLPTPRAAKEAAQPSTVPKNSP